ncbi:MAG: thiamine biosynthesis lipoprotein [Myxococcota bacterium]
MNKNKLLIVACLVLGACSQKPSELSEYKLSGLVMGTSWHATCLSQDEVQQQTVSTALDEVDALMSTYKNDSEISLFNQSSTGAEMSPISVYVIEVAVGISEKSDGAFDPTVMPLVDIWGFGPGKGDASIPDAKRIADVMQHCGWQHLLLDNESFFVGKRIPELEIDLSAIAKGFGADHAARALELKGIDNYMIEVGGEIRVKGQSIHARPWRLAIDSPNEADYTRIIELSSGAIATSGDYRNTRMLDGKLFSHTIDPRSGYPVKNNLASVSIVATNCTIADAMATTCMVLGAEDGMRLVESMPDVEAYFIRRLSTDVFSITASSGFPPALNLD